MGLLEQVQEGGIRWPTLENQAQRLVEGLPVPAGKSLQITGAAAAAQDPQDCHQQQERLRVANPTTIAAIGDGLEVADQVIRNGLINCSRAGFGTGGRGGRWKWLWGWVEAIDRGLADGLE